VYAFLPNRESGRWFVAIRDNQLRIGDPPEELTFTRHQLIKVYGDVDGNGYFWAEIHGRNGLVPAWKLVELPNDGLFLEAEQRGGADEQQQQRM
jgi:hypothetical protein